METSTAETSTADPRRGRGSEALRTALLLITVVLSGLAVSIQMRDHATVNRIEAETRAAAARPAAQIRINAQGFSARSLLDASVGAEIKLRPATAEDPKTRVSK